MGGIISFLKNSVLRKIPIIGAVLASLISIIEALFDPIASIKENWRNISIFFMVFMCSKIMVSIHDAADAGTLGYVYGSIVFIALLYIIAIIFEKTKCSNASLSDLIFKENNFLILVTIIFCIMHFIFLAEPFQFIKLIPSYRVAKKLLSGTLGSLIFGFLISSYYSDVEYTVC